jgi:hypothetical protein
MIGESVVEPTTEPKLGLAQRNTSWPGTSLKDLPILVLCHFNNRGSWGRLRESVVEPRLEPKLGPTQRNTSSAETSLKDLHILARGCHGTWLPRVTGLRQNSIL